MGFEKEDKLSYINKNTKRSRMHVHPTAINFKICKSKEGKIKFSRKIGNISLFEAQVQIAETLIFFIKNT
jgi:hypothetical protein